MDAEHLRTLRAAIGVSRPALSRLLGVSEASVLRWEDGASKPRALQREILLALEAHLDAKGKDLTKALVARSADGDLRGSLIELSRYLGGQPVDRNTKENPMENDSVRDLVNARQLHRLKVLGSLYSKARGRPNTSVDRQSVWEAASLPDVEGLDAVQFLTRENLITSHNGSPLIDLAQSGLVEFEDVKTGRSTKHFPLSVVEKFNDVETEDE